MILFSKLDIFLIKDKTLRVLSELQYRLPDTIENKLVQIIETNYNPRFVPYVGIL